MENSIDSIKNILKINFFLILAYFFALILEKSLSFVFLTYILGTVIFFLPGLNLALALEQITIKMGRAKLALWSFLFSLILTPAFIFYLPMGSEKIAQERETLLSFFLLTFISLSLFLLAYLWKKGEISPVKIPSFRKHSAFWIAAAIFILILGAHFLIYPFIPEADGYGYLAATENSIKIGTYAVFDARVIFLTFSTLLFHLTKIPLFLIYKIIFPLFGIFTWLVFFKISRNLFREKWKVILGSLAPLFFPIFSLDLLIPRPQIVFTLVFPIYLYLLDGLRKVSFQKSWPSHLALLLLAGFGILFHQSFFFLIGIHFLATAICFRKSFKLRSFSAYFFLGTAFIAVFSLARIPIFSSYLDNLWSLIKNNFSPADFRWWFLDDYTDTYGEKMGWPGISFLYYYGYNLGFIFPILIFFAFIKKIKISLKENYVYILGFLPFFFFAEITPRFGLAYVPNRMWLFVSLTLAFFIPSLFRQLENKMTDKKLKYISLILVSGTLLLNWGLTLEKQGWINMAEFRTAEFIRESTEKNAMFIAPGGSHLAIGYFGKRLAVAPADEFYLQNIPEKDRLILDNLTTVLRYRPVVNNKIIDHIPSLMKYVYSGSALAPDLTHSEKQPPIYVFYSQNKFAGIKGNRPWWREMNFFGADLAKFNDAEMYEKVYDKEGVRVWKYRQ